MATKNEKKSKNDTLKYVARPTKASVPTDQTAIVTKNKKSDLIKNVQKRNGQVVAFDFERDGPKLYATSGEYTAAVWDFMRADSTDLSSYKARNGKLVIVHGVSDPIFSINDTIQWYKQLTTANNGAASSFVRMFAVPGMNHCQGGPGTDQYDAFGALVDWVEKGNAPERIVATAGANTPWPGRTRPLCPYPAQARYSGQGSVEEAGNFSCRVP